MPSDHGRFLPGAMLGSRYRVVALLGRGGMGEVYRCDDLELGQSVALKLLPADLAGDRRWIERLRAEVRTARQISHPNVCRVYDIGEADGHVFLTMEYVDGGDLAQTLRRLGRPSREKALEIARQLCLGLAAAHDAGVLHRDLKPANVMLDGRGRVRLTDFGLAGLAQELATKNEIAGTPAYMAPEQLEAGQVSVQSDIYSLGLILYELFTGKRVFSGETPDEIRRSRSSSSVPTMASAVAEVDPVVERVVVRCLEADPAQRPPSIYAVLGALPGGDPLAAALAAGETPSPDLVAGSRDKGGLQPRTVAAMLATVAIGVFGFAAFNQRNLLYPEKHPDELAIRAQTVVENLGYVDLPEFSVGDFVIDDTVAGFIRRDGFGRQEALGLSLPTYRYWRRFSPERLESSEFHAPEEIRLNDPPRRSAGEVSIVVDDSGRLAELLVIPEGTNQPFEPVDFDWDQLHSLSGIDPATLAHSEMVKPAPIYCDQTAAWKARLGDGLDLTIQAGLFRGRPVYYEQVAAEDGVTGGTDEPTGAGRYFFGFLTLGLWAGAVTLAWRNIKLGRGDRRSAFRFAMVMLVAYLLIETVAVLSQNGGFMDHLLGLVWTRPGGHILIHVAQVWLMYMAIEPYVRRLWPRMLIAWVRLLGGNLRDPAVGREILTGITFGVAMAVVFPISVVALDVVGVSSVWPVLRASQITSLNGWWSGLIDSMYMISSSMLSLMFFAVYLLIVRLVIRRSVPSNIVSVLLLGFLAAASSGGPEVMRAPPAAIIAVSLIGSVGIVFLFTRIGMVAALAAIVAQSILSAPVSTDIGAWYGGLSLYAFTVIGGLAVWGGWAALAGTPFLDRLLAEPEG